LKKLLLVLTAAVTFGLSAASAGTLYAIDDSSNTLLQINPITAAVTVIGSTGVGAGDFGDLTYDPLSGQLYWVPGRGDDNLYTINPATGLATLVGVHGIDDLFALAWDTSNNTLYADSTSGNFYSLDPTTGASTLIGSNSVYPAGLVYNPVAKTMYLLNAGIDDVYSVDLATGAATYAFGGSFSANDAGITYDPSTNTYWVDSWNNEFYQYNADFTSRTAYPYANPLDGIAYVGADSGVPEPGTTFLLGGGLLAAGLLRLRRKAQ
jgi:DNA-binding beta-propeller fold protein YncE